MAEITYQDLVIDENDISVRKIRVEGGVPTDWTSNEGQKFDHVNVTVSEPYYKDKSFGRGTSNYRYGKASDIDRFKDFKTPFFVKASVLNGTDKNGKSVGIIIDIDFRTVEELEIVPRQKSKTPVASSAPAANPPVAKA